MNTPDFYSRMSNEPEGKEEGLDFYSRIKPQKSKLEKAGRTAAQYGIGAAETALFPYEVGVSPLKSKGAQALKYRETVHEDIERLLEQKNAGIWDESDEELFQSLIQQIKNPEEAEKFVKTADIGVGDIAEKGAEKLGYDLKPQGGLEHGSRIAGNIISPNALVKGVKALPDLGKGLVNKEFRHAIKEQKNWSRLAKAAEGNAERETLLKFAKEHNLSPEATSLLYQTKGKAELVTQIGKRTKKFKGAVSELKNKLGNNYEELKRLAEEGGTLDFEEANRVANGLEGLLNEMKSTHVIGPEAAPVIKTLENAVESIMKKPSTAKELINSRVNLSDSINWRNIERGDFYRTEARKVFADAIAEKNPALGKRLLDTDRAWAKYEQFKDVLDPKIPTFKFKGLSIPTQLMTGAIFLAPLAGAISMGTAAKAYGFKEAVQRISTQLVLNPKFQKPLKILQKEMLRGSTKGIKQAFLVIKHLAKKEDPEIYEDLKDIEVE